jgi:hypothetical protein
MEHRVLVKPFSRSSEPSLTLFLPRPCSLHGKGGVASLRRTQASGRSAEIEGPLGVRLTCAVRRADSRHMIHVVHIDA